VSADISFLQDETIVRHVLTRKRLLFGTLILTGILGAVVMYTNLTDYTDAIAEQRSKSGLVVLDRNDRVLRMFPGARERFCWWRSIDTVPEHVKHAFIASEDRRFYYHPGFDPSAIVRALITNISHGRTISGASTITQQVVRLIHPRPRTYTAKLIELLEGIKMELQLSKEEILELYLNLSPLGGNMRGVGLAARTYFSKDVSQITVPEAALLAGLPQSPSRYDPRHPKGRRNALREKNKVLRRMASCGWVDRDRLSRLLVSDIQFHFRALPLEAPHFVDFVVSEELPERPIVETTLDLRVQRMVTSVLESHRARLAKLGIEQAGALIVSVPDGDILAMVGSLGYSSTHEGYNNATLARRGAGSTLKPFLYGLALADGYHASSEIPDTFRVYQTPHGDYLPLNADRRSYGPVTIRTALGNSLNISAVKTLRALGIDEFFELLKQLGLVDENSLPAEQYGLGMAIGNVEVSLFQLVGAYTALAREGRYAPLEWLKGQDRRSSQVFSPAVAYVISHILADPSARLLTFGNPSCFDFGFPVSFKTGTSSNYRDCWIVGYTPKHVVGIWAGNFDGRPTGDVTGSKAGGPILQELMTELCRAGPSGAFARPKNVSNARVSWMTGKPVDGDCPYAYPELFIGDPPTAEACVPAESEEHRFVLGAPYAKWVTRRALEYGEGRFRLADRDEIPRSQSHSITADISVSRARGPVGESVSIVSPQPMDRFILSPHQANRIRFRAMPASVVTHVTWLVDGVEVAQTPPPYEYFWQPTRGQHTVLAVTPGRAADRVIIHVE
jgi:penicillin-binding protein 1C